MQDKNAGDLVILGRVTGVFGVKGYVKIFSYTQDPLTILDYPNWLLRKEGCADLRRSLADGKKQGKGIIAKFKSLDDRDEAALLAGYDILVSKSELPPLESGAYYWSDLVGAKVVTEANISLGNVDHLLTTGSNDVMVLKGDKERLVPFIQPDVIKNVDLTSKTITVDWDPDF